MTMSDCGDTTHSLFNFLPDLCKAKMLIQGGIDIHRFFVDLERSTIWSDSGLTTCSRFNFLLDPHNAKMRVRSAIDIRR
jgi:hypothetical protein